MSLIPFVAFWMQHFFLKQEIDTSVITAKRSEQSYG